MKGKRLRCILDCDGGAALVLAALLAGAVRQLLLAAVRAVGDAGRSQEIMAAALRGALLRVTPFRVRHGEPLVCGREAQGIAGPNLGITFLLNG
jgi:hypothetical protein